LERAGYEVQSAKDGQIALELISKQMPDLIVLDLMLPHIDGYELTRWIRDQSNVPIIMLTARRSEADKIAGLEMGADDYIVKPFSPHELVSRVRAVLRRTLTSTDTDTEKPLSFPDLTIDPQTRLVNIRNEEIILTVKEFDMLWLLASHPRHVFSRQRLLENVWGLSDYIDPGTVTVHIRRLREKIEKDPSDPERILTVWGVGYKFEP
jgi:DNA-binding response OmpR family regulator